MDKSTIEFEHLKALQEIPISKLEYSRSIMNNFAAWQKMYQKRINSVDEPTAENIRMCQIKSAQIADDMQTYYETEWVNPNDKSEVESSQSKKSNQQTENSKTETQKPKTMLTPEQIERAKAVGLTDKATVQQIEDAEIKAAEDIAEKEKLKKEAEQEAASQQAAKTASDEAAKEAAKQKKQIQVEQEEDIFDELGI